ncbi:MAG: YbjN domain-containing protein [Alphaproteobacteria bacterium]|nr:YbjN domain-containing protein [Alphaproteobacteria bacterium]
MTAQIEITEKNLPNPLDRVEEILDQNHWVYSRMGEDKLALNLSGKSSEYEILFLWDRDFNALQFLCQYNLSISAINKEALPKVLSDINTSLWMGHFELEHLTNSPIFRYTSLLQNSKGQAVIDLLERLIDIGLKQCERYQHVFYILSSNMMIDPQMLSLAMMDVAGES